MTVMEARGAIASGSLRSEELVRACLDRAASLESALRCFLEVFAERALERAAEIDRAIEGGRAASEIGPLAGVPIAVKDNMCLEYGRTTCGSRMLENYRSPITATVLTKLIEAGAIILGKTNMDEFAMGSSTEHSAFGPTRNPWDTTRAPGGSSGGSAAAVSARIVPAALGSDTGGSVRQPAALCGVVGFKPTYGMVSRWGLVAYASSLDQIGPITRSVGDAALLFQVIAGRDPRDATSVDAPAAPATEEIERPIEGMRIGAPRQARGSRGGGGEDGGGKNHCAVGEAFEAAIEVFRSLGAEVVEVDLPHVELGVPAYYLIATAEASSNLARFDGVRYGRRATASAGETVARMSARSRSEGFGAEVQRRIMLGTFALSSGYYEAYYLRALKVRRRIKEDFDRVFGGACGCDAIITPATANPAFALGAKRDDPLAMYLEDIYTVTANLAGLPAISVPAGFAKENGVRLPVGLQILAPAFGEGRLLRVARGFERATRWNEQAPDIIGIDESDNETTRRGWHGGG